MIMKWITIEKDMKNALFHKNIIKAKPPVVNRQKNKKTAFFRAVFKFLVDFFVIGGISLRYRFSKF